jgi:hypothetical protein
MLVFDRRRYACARNSPEPESRNGLSLAHNDAFATIAGSTLLACPFVSPRKILQTRSIHCSPTPFGFEADPGRDPRFGPVAYTDFPRSCCSLRSPLPFRSFEPSGSKRSNGEPQEARLTGRSIVFRSPPRSSFDVSFDSASDQRSKLASSSDFRFANSLDPTFLRG